MIEEKIYYGSLLVSVRQFDQLFGARGIAPTSAVRIRAEAQADAMAWTYAQTTISPAAPRCAYCGTKLETLRCESCGAPDRG